MGGVTEEVSTVERVLAQAGEACAIARQAFAAGDFVTGIAALQVATELLQREVRRARRNLPVRSGAAAAAQSGADCVEPVGHVYLPGVSAAEALEDMLDGCLEVLSDLDRDD